ncbi:hypothetical protein CSA57_09260 [candidate division KSB3 bacterium]|nr:MAG: hypothetical protein CSA57_09260 [candidate division KSB3 bacterium]
MEFSVSGSLTDTKPTQDLISGISICDPETFIMQVIEYQDDMVFTPESQRTPFTALAFSQNG